MSRVKGFFLSENEKGELKFDVIKAVATAAVSFFVLWAIWVTTQCYDVATNKNLIISTAETLEKDIASNKATIGRNNQVLHMRATKIDDKYDAKMTEMHKMLMQTNTLIVEMLIQKNKEIQLKKEEVEIQRQMPMQQQAPKWPVSPHNG